MPIPQKKLTKTGINVARYLLNNKQQQKPKTRPKAQAKKTTSPPPVKRNPVPATRTVAPRPQLVPAPKPQASTPSTTYRIFNKDIDRSTVHWTGGTFATVLGLYGLYRILR